MAAKNQLAENAIKYSDPYLWESILKKSKLNLP